MEWLANNWAPALAMLGALITVVAALVISIQEKDRQLRYERRITALNVTIAEKSDQITRLTEQNLGAITGGDSFCYVTLIAREDAAGPMVIVVQQGKYPLYDIDLRIEDLKRRSGPLPAGSSADQLVATDQRFHPGTLAASSSVLVGRMPPLRGDAEGFNLFFSARNGFWTQLLRLRKVDGTWKMATKVTRGPAPGQVSEQVLIPERVEDRFPRNAAGQVDWQ